MKSVNNVSEQVSTLSPVQISPLRGRVGERGTTPSLPRRSNSDPEHSSEPLSSSASPPIKSGVAKLHYLPRKGGDWRPSFASRERPTFAPPGAGGGSAPRAHGRE